MTRLIFKMSATSRGCLLRHGHAFFTPRSGNTYAPIYTLRLFTTTTSLHAARKSHPLSAKEKAKHNANSTSKSHTNSNTPSKSKYPKPNAPSKPQTTTNPPPKTKSSTIISPFKPLPTKERIYATYAAQLAAKPEPTPLYQAPSHTAYIASNYSTALFCYSWAAFNGISNYVFAPAGLHYLVSPAYLVISILMMGGGTYIILGSTRLIHSIRAIPPSCLPASVSRPVKLDQDPNGGLQLEFKLRKSVPIPYFFPAETFYISPSDMLLKYELAPPTDYVRPTKQQLQAEEAKRKDAEAEYDRTHLMTSPFRHMSRAFHRMFRGTMRSVLRTWTRDGFMGVRLGEDEYRLDVREGMMLDGGKALDRLGRVEAWRGKVGLFR